VTDDPAPTAARPPKLWPIAVGYVLLRLLLTAVLTGILLGVGALFDLGMPVLVALMLAIILQMPLAWLVLARQRTRVEVAMAASAGRRRRTRDDLRAALAGGARPDPVDEVDRGSR
jgi:hypothetical protein